MANVSTDQFRKRLSEFMELAYYKSEQVRVNRKGRPMARLVGEPFMQAIDEFVEYIIEKHPAWADT